MNSVYIFWILLVSSSVIGFTTCFIFQKTKELNVWSTKALLVMTGAYAGFISCVLLCHYDLLKFDGVLTIGNIVQASATVIVGLLVASYIQRHTQAERKEKDMLLKHLDLVIAALEDFEQFKDGGVLTKITASLKKLSVQCKSVNDLLKHLNYPNAIISQTNFENQIKTIRKLATETPIKKIQEHAVKTRCTSSVRDGIIQWAEEKAALLDTEILKMKTAVLKAEVEINRV